MNDPMLLSPKEVLTIYLNELSHLSAEGWREYLKMDDIFATNSEEYASAVDQTYSEKIAEYFSYTIESCTMDGDTAIAKLTITSINMHTPPILSPVMIQVCPMPPPSIFWKRSRKMLYLPPFLSL